MHAPGTHDDAVTRLPEDPPGDGSSANTAATGLLAQIQQLISQVASAPITRDVAAKAAELAAVAAEKAGPAARSLAAKTEEVGQSVAERATTFATSMRHDEHSSAQTADAAPTTGAAPDQRQDPTDTGDAP